MNQQQKDQFARAMGIPAEDQVILDNSSNHPYNCRCIQCLDWWVLMGPDGGEPGKYGPFTRTEVVVRADETGKDMTHLL